MIKHWRSYLFASLIAVTAPSPTAFAADTLIEPWTSSWKYLDDGSNQGSAWQNAAFDDSSWASGLAELGYGDGDETTVVNSGPVDNHFITTYFRHSFNVADASSYQSLIFDVLRDDGMVVYLNGTEIWRDNMPAGAVAYDTLATATAENTLSSITLDSSALVTGNNTIAVEIHQVTSSSSDISFVLQLTASSSPPPPPPNPDLVRGPYLQMITPTSAIIRWRTPVANDSKVNFGTSPGSLSNQVTSSTLTTEHEIQLSGLTANTTYYYDIGTSSGIISGGSDHFFKTQPLAGSKPATRIWVIGDSGRNNAGQREVYQGYLDYTGSTYTDLWLLLGDNAYNTGTDAEYQAGFFDIYTGLMRQTVVWPSLGNHDGYSVNTPLQTGPYYDIFTLPKNAEVGGVASSTEAYYSFDYGNIHVIALDSYDMDRATTAAMATWLKADLAATTADWIIAYWHHPPYSKGSHDSDTSDGNDCWGSSTGICSWNAMIEMRSNILPILEARGVDLVLTGHSHSYERSKFVDGHYGDSSSYSDSAHAIDTNSGDPGAGAQAYVKAHPAVANGGTVYAVAGTSASADGGSLNHPVMFRSLNQLGSLILDVNDLLLTAKFIDTAGVVQDSFTLQKKIYSKQRHDRNADGDSDVLVRSATNGNWTSHNIRNAAIKGNHTLGLPTDSNTAYIAQLDANGDKDADILTRNNSTGAWTLHQIQNGTVVASGPLYLYASLDMQFIGSGDFNNDGSDDVMLRSSSAGYYTVFLLNNHAVASTVFYNAWTSAQSVPQGIGDFDGDSTDDLLVRRTSDNLYFVFRTSNGGTTANYCACNLWNNPDWTFQYAGDTNKDGIDDVVIRGTGATGDGKWWAFRMNNFVSTLTTNLNLFSNKTAVSFASSGDYNGDGTIDVLTRVNNATTYVSPLNNGLVTANTFLAGFTTDQVIGK